MSKKDVVAYVEWSGRFVRGDACMIPLGLVDEQALRLLTPGTKLAIYVSRPRTDKQHAYMRWLAQIGAENSPGRPTPRGIRPWEPETILNQVKTDLGLFDGFITHLHDDGRVASTRHNFKSSSDFSLEEMSDYIDRLKDFIVEICPGIDPAELEPKRWEDRNYRRPDADRTRKPAAAPRGDRPKWQSED